MHRVYGAQAMQDPTAIEILVKEEMVNRFKRHEERNSERKLNKEQRREKKKKKVN